MKLYIFSIVLDGMPWITQHIQIFNRLSPAIDWNWIIVEGAASNTRDTRWCKPNQPRLSADGTTEYLDGLSNHPRVRVIRNKIWDGKVSMCNAALNLAAAPGVLLQVDSDEIWTAVQIEKIVERFATDLVDVMKFDCNYFIGPNIVTTDHSADWIRAWRYEPGMQFDTHEPPVLAGNKGLVAPRELTRAAGLMFDHMSYVTIAQVKAKEQFYGYTGATSQWQKLQQNKTWPIPVLRSFLKFAGARAAADRYVS